MLLNERCFDFAKDIGANLTAIFFVHVFIGWKSGEAQITDFGLSRKEVASDSSAEEDEPTEGTVEWIAPERINGLPGTRASDVFSFYIFMFELLVGEYPHKGKKPREIVKLLSRGKRLPLPSNEQLAKRSSDLVSDLNRCQPEPLPEIMRELYHNCSSEEPEERPTMEEVVRTIETVASSLPRAEGGVDRNGPTTDQTFRSIETGAPHDAVEALAEVASQHALKTPPLLPQQAPTSLSQSLKSVSSISFGDLESPRFLLDFPPPPGPSAGSAVRPPVLKEARSSPAPIKTTTTTNDRAQAVLKAAVLLRRVAEELRDLRAAFDASEGEVTWGALLEALDDPSPEQRAAVARALQDTAPLAAVARPLTFDAVVAAAAPVLSPLLGLDAPPGSPCPSGRSSASSNRRSNDHDDVSSLHLRRFQEEGAPDRRSSSDLEPDFMAALDLSVLALRSKLASSQLTDGAPESIASAFGFLLQEGHSSPTYE